MYIHICGFLCLHVCLYAITIRCACAFTRISSNVRDGDLLPRVWLRERTLMMCYSFDGLRCARWVHSEWIFECASFGGFRFPCVCNIVYHVMDKHVDVLYTYRARKMRRCDGTWFCANGGCCAKTDLYFHWQIRNGDPWIVLDKVNKNKYP